MATTTTVRPSIRSAHRCSHCGLVHSPNPMRGGQPAFCCSCCAWAELLEDVSRYTADLWAAEAVVPDLEATTSQQAITEMVEALVSENKLSDQLSEILVRAFLFDADETSAAIEHGLAVLLITHPAVQDPLVLVARSQNGIDFQAVDDQPAKVFLLLVSPPQSPAEQLRLTAEAARLLLDYERRSNIV
jgi:mannitol/fructose-specific phosphotransferase system IIA component (Ntr-type)